MEGSKNDRRVNLWRLSYKDSSGASTLSFLIHSYIRFEHVVIKQFLFWPVRGVEKIV